MTKKTVTEKWWALFNTQTRGKPVLVPGSIFCTKRATLQFRDEYPFRQGFVPRPITVTFEAP